MNANVALVPKTKKCKACGEAKPLDDFYRNPAAALGRQSYCKPCSYAKKLESARNNPQTPRAQARSRMTSRNKSANFRPWLATLKSNPCVDCGGKFPPECMDFDHVRGEKKFGINNQAFGRTAESLFAEIDKCDLVCSNCHRIRTTARKRVK